MPNISSPNMPFHQVTNSAIGTPFRQWFRVTFTRINEALGEFYSSINDNFQLSFAYHQTQKFVVAFLGSTFSNVVFYIWMPLNGLLDFMLVKTVKIYFVESCKLIFWSWTPKRSPAYPVKISLTATRVLLTYQLSNVPHAMAIVCLIESDYVL